MEFWVNSLTEPVATRTVCFLLRWPPSAEDFFDFTPHFSARPRAVGALHKDFVVIRMPVADRCDNGQSNTFLI